MKLLRFRAGNQVRLGALLETGYVVDLGRCGAGIPGGLRQVLAHGPDYLRELAGIIRQTQGGWPLDDVELLAPIPDPQKFLGIGFNYRSHINELRRTGRPIPDLTNQVWFNKQVSCIAGPYDPIHLPSQSDQLDYEGELAVVIGRRCRRVAKEDVEEVIAGYMVCNDVSVRDWQHKAPTATLGKSFDTHGPTGPWLTTADEVATPAKLAIKTWVDGELRQDGNTDEMIHGIREMIAYVTSVFTLEPGDILATGTPVGVGAGATPPTYLKAGQRVRVEIEGLGHINNEIVAEPLSATTYIS